MAVKTQVRFQVMALMENSYDNLRNYISFFWKKKNSEKNMEIFFENYVLSTGLLYKNIFFKEYLRENYIGKNLTQKIKKLFQTIKDWHLVLKKKTNLSLKSKLHMRFVQKKLLKKFSKIKKKI